MSVFVFGSNIRGEHGAGAARHAVERFGAIMGQGEGLHGASYAIPTMEGWESLVSAVARFLVFAMENPSMTFQVTRIGTGIAGWADEEVAPLFQASPENCQFSSVWLPWLPDREVWTDL
jgi:hypothetical protein